MKVALVAPFAMAPKGTTSARVMPMARALASRGHECVVLIPPYDNRREWSPPKSEDGVRLIWAVPTEHRHAPALRTPHDQIAMYKQIVQRLDAVDPDVVHVFKPKAVSGLVQLDLWFRRVPAALVLDCDDWEGRGGWSQFERYPWALKWAFDFQERFSLGRNDAVTVASDELARRMADYGKPVVKIPNFNDPARYRGWSTTDNRRKGRAVLGVQDERPVGLIYSRFFEYPLTGFASLIQRFLARLPEARFLVLGRGQRGEHVELERLNAIAGLSSRIQYWGWPGLERAGQALAAVDVALMPSVDTIATRSKCPVRLLDLAVAGVPAAAHDVGEARTYIRQGVNGALVSGAEVDPLVDAAVDLARKAGRPRDAALSDRLLRGDLSLAKAADDLEAVYGEALRRRAAR